MGWVEQSVRLTAAKRMDFARAQPIVRATHGETAGMAKKSAPGQETAESERAGDASDEDIVVFSITGHAVCRECGTTLPKGSYLRSENKQPFCLACADLDHLVFLPRGDTALTRRARKHSALSAVVVRFSRARKRYERQGVLVEESALEQAGAECSADAEQRNVRRERAEIYRDKQDQGLAMRMAESIRQMFPG